MKKIYLLPIYLMLLVSCGNPKVPTDTQKAQPFPYTKIPAMLGNEAKAYQYISNHFWDDFFNPSRNYTKDTNLVGGVIKSNFEKAYLQYLHYLDKNSIKNMLCAQKILMDKAEAKEKVEPKSIIWETLINLSEKYLFDPNSPYRNEEYFIPVLEKLTKTELTDSTKKSRYDYLLTLCSLNRLGTPAKDFSFTLNNGRTSSLYKTKANFILILFSNPGCDNCKEVIDILSSSKEVNWMIKEKKLAVLNIYPDADLTEWYNYMKFYPKNWINGFDHKMELNSNTIYYIRAVPSLYLLDTDKKVIFKDGTPKNILKFLVYQSDFK
jgi:hypothetical protein